MGVVRGAGTTELMPVCMTEAGRRQADRRAVEDWATGFPSRGILKTENLEISNLENVLPLASDDFTVTDFKIFRFQDSFVRRSLPVHLLSILPAPVLYLSLLHRS